MAAFCFPLLASTFRPLRYMIFYFLKELIRSSVSEFLYLKTIAVIDFSLFCLVVEAAAKMRLFLMPVKCYFHLFSDYFFIR